MKDFKEKQQTFSGVNAFSNSTRCILEDFMVLLKRTYDFSGFEELEKYFSYVKNADLSKNNVFIFFCIYRLSYKLRNRELKDFECDCCKDITELYKATYCWLNNFVCENTSKTSEKYQLRQPDTNTLFKGDTMTSVFTPLKEYFKLKSGIQCTSSKTEDWEVYWLKNIDAIDISESAADFIYWGYSFANFLPVPEHFNAGRSNCGKWDSWDLTLIQIYQWYLDNPQMDSQTDNRALEKLFKCTRNTEVAVSYCTEWLKSFHSWENFVEQNYMQSFILPDGRPKKFFQNHTLEYKLPKTLDEYEAFFKNAVSCIAEREKLLKTR